MLIEIRNIVLIKCHFLSYNIKPKSRVNVCVWNGLIISCLQKEEMSCWTGNHSVGPLRIPCWTMNWLSGHFVTLRQYLHTVNSYRSGCGHNSQTNKSTKLYFYVTACKTRKRRRVGVNQISLYTYSLQLWFYIHICLSSKLKYEVLWQFMSTALHPFVLTSSLILTSPRFYCDYCDTYLTHDSVSSLCLHQITQLRTNLCCVLFLLNIH